VIAEGRVLLPAPFYCYCRVPLDKREGSVKGKNILGSAGAPLFEREGEESTADQYRI